MKELISDRIVQGYRFNWVEEHEMFECRGQVHYDEEHDEMAEPKLWKAALLLERMLNSEGKKAEANYSEKGWVQVDTVVR